MGDYFNYYSASRQTVIYQIIAANWYFMTLKGSFTNILAWVQKPRR